MTHITVPAPTINDWKESGAAQIHNVESLGTGKPFVTKSMAELTVHVGLSMGYVMQKFLRFDGPHQEPDIRGLRIYRVSKIPQGTIGGTEFHRQRQEMVWCTRGRVRWICEDLKGKQEEWVLENGTGVWMPPFILHTYSALEANSELIVLCNTIFDATDPRTHDTWSAEVFKELQRQL